MTTIVVEKPAMPHVTFIHGILNKPPKEDLLRHWRLSLAGAQVPFDLDAAGVTYSMAYWADVLYAEPDSTGTGESSVDELQSIEVDAVLDERVKSSTESTPEQTAWIRSMRQRLGVMENGDLLTTENSLNLAPETMAEGLERIPLPWPIKKAFLELFLRDVHHYLFNEPHSPREGVNYLVQDEIRSRFLQAAEQSASTNGPHIVVSHSMGTVIAYDCLKRVTECPPVDHFITLGSPLGIDEVRDKLQPGWTEIDGFPSEKVNGKWLNFYDPFDVVSRLDPRLSENFLKNGVQLVEDVKQRNDSSSPHALSGYMRGRSVSQAIKSLFN